MNRADGLLVRPVTRSPWRVVAIVAIGFLLGALLTKLSLWFLPEGPFLEFFTTTISASVGPLSVDLLVIAFTLGPLVLNVNLFSVAGVLVVAYLARMML
ncbi:MAG: DUF4321 domain-containing protein [Gemmatimonadetes bacterium]|uniref:DUF4321 domain-containing protein n=1 Tax=Candidatus Kutchimonas denitrificans TaxID=3056748 RepID=A0AAE5CB09_9BACT|nr:DUF4321 domain-containing protein [Gemmatimonadota bacterium]NIR73920.1 DUF4321 domain-containing protein [Candidatus Kutchimonas denitrificans]NIR99726.1 DUF4321 domain-containing protein [Gemmatimonadota bacterium]NIT65311.1 DUF4321 domain-containing protein [Gemmatimonadota bacterium]NIW73760.1 DUF4321 domain-containing protein [Gemmatimonadota bacterium]